ncbi:MAG TPA: hypothetical protein VFW34_08725 [Candidatus Rubrimentiphilum sp.]|nr:hypothetical protein [Candidatus Rubrimentiphilum sp.]
MYITQDDLSKNSGYAFRVDRLRRAMEKAGAAVEVVGLSLGRPAIESTVVQLRSPLGRLWTLFAGLFRRADYAVITSIGAPYNGIYAWLLRLFGKRVIYDLHDPVLYSLTEVFGKGPLMRVALPYLAFSEHLIDRAAVATVAASPSAIDLYKQRRWHGPMKLAYNVRDIPTGTHEGRSIREPFAWTDATIVVYVGGLQRGVRGVEQQLAAITEARGRSAPVVLLMLGFRMLGMRDGAYFEKLGRPLIEENALHILDDVPPAEMAKILQQCDVAISSEPIGYLMQSKYFDYLCNGVRVVAIDDNRDLIRAFGNLVDTYDGSTAALADYLAGRPARLAEAQIEQARYVTRELDRMADSAVREILAH